MISFVGVISTRYSVGLFSASASYAPRQGGITCTDCSSHADGQKLVKSQLAGVGSHQIPTKASVNKTSSKCHVPGLRRILLYHRSIMTSSARMVSTRAGSKADSPRFAVAFWDRTNQLGDFVGIMSQS